MSLAQPPPALEEQPTAPAVTATPRVPSPVAEEARLPTPTQQHTAPENMTVPELPDVPTHLPVYIPTRPERVPKRKYTESEDRLGAAQKKIKHQEELLGVQEKRIKSLEGDLDQLMGREA